MGNAVKRVRDALRRGLRCKASEQGQAYVELLLVLPLYVVLIAGAIHFGRAWYARVGAEMAAYDGTRTAIEAMGEARGTWQGVIAARETLAGFYLDPASADVRVVPVDVWGRGQAVRCDVRYRVDLSGLPWIHWISADPVLPVWARAVGQVEAYKSEW
jgi:hypothetical protein